jgi:hypothetical protein
MGLNVSVGNNCVDSPVALGYVKITDGHTPAANVGFDLACSLEGAKPTGADVLVKEYSSYLD